jgi:hypothetical protein
MVSRIELICILKNFQNTTGVDVGNIKRLKRKELLKICEDNGITIQNVEKDTVKKVKEVKEVGESPKEKSNNRPDLERINYSLQASNIFLRQENIALFKVIYDNGLYNDYMTNFNRMRADFENDRENDIRK